MARIARIVATGYPYHIAQRGNNKQAVFLDNADRKTYLELIKRHSVKYQLDILAYCLMTNHVHFIVIPNAEKALAKTFNFAHMRYSQYFNKKMGMCGHLWQGRFYSCVMDEKYVYACARYIERNPVRAKIVKNPLNYKWSSARIHCGMEKNDELGVKKLFNYVGNNPKEWSSFIVKVDKDEDVTAIRGHTLKGAPIGEEKFIKKLENKLGRILKLRPRGRPKKIKQ